MHNSVQYHNRIPGIGLSVQQMWKFYVAHFLCHIILTAAGFKGSSVELLVTVPKKGKKKYSINFTDFDEQVLNFIVYLTKKTFKASR